MRSGSRSKVKVRCGLTLTELLVVLAIIAVLLSLSIPAVMKARESARRTQCHSNLRQIVLALNQYVDTHTYFPDDFEV